MSSYTIISADSHVLEPHDLWTTRLEGTPYEDRAPHMVEHDTHGHLFIIDGLKPFPIGLAGAAGKASSELRASGDTADSLRAAEAVLADFRATNVDFSRSPRLATREAELQRRVSLALQTYTTIAQRYELANIEAVRNTPVVTVIDAPEGLVEARPRHTASIAFAAFAFGLVLAVVIALNGERLAARR